MSLSYVGSEGIGGSCSRKADATHVDVFFGPLIGIVLGHGPDMIRTTFGQFSDAPFMALDDCRGISETSSASENLW